MRFAILDFGTNTFNLLIAEQKGDSFDRIYTGKQPVKLGKGGINKGLITGEGMARGMEAISRHMETIAAYRAGEITAYATSAFRNARNGASFARQITERFGFPVQIISGTEEAELIYRGIRTSVRFNNEKAMILDIGGGSNEFIICDRDRMWWKHSFELGMARILEQFEVSDPITTGEVVRIEDHFRSELGLLFERVREYRPEILVGASGSFDTLAAMLKHRLGADPSDRSPMTISLEQMQDLKQVIVESTMEEREKMPGMEPVRIEMIAPAVIFINLVITDCSIRSVVQSDYALKEGVVARLIENKQ